VGAAVVVVVVVVVAAAEVHAGVAVAAEAGADHAWITCSGRQVIGKSLTQVKIRGFAEFQHVGRNYL